MSIWTWKSTFEHDGLSRSFRVINGTRSSLVIILHGKEVGRQKMMSRYQHIFQLGFSILYPEGIGTSWNADYCCGEALEKKIRDVDFIMKLNEFVLKQYFQGTIKRVYITGTSNGGLNVPAASKLGIQCSC